MFLLNIVRNLKDRESGGMTGYNRALANLQIVVGRLGLRRRHMCCSRNSDYELARSEAMAFLKEVPEVMSPKRGVAFSLVRRNLIPRSQFSLPNRAKIQK
jgi:hypothetical protein